MKRPPFVLGILAASALGFPGISLSEQQAVTGEKSVVFPQSTNCTANSACRNVVGEIARMEGSSYWIKMADGREIKLNVTKDTKMEGHPILGDSIAAQLLPTGDADAIVDLVKMPKPKKK